MKGVTVALVATTVLSAEATKYAAIGLFDESVANFSLSRMIGNVTKHAANPLLIQDVPWEPRLDNAYPNMAFDGETYQIFYGNCISSLGAGATDCSMQTLQYANSTDGLAWTKPNLGLYDLNKDAIREDLRQYGTANNIIMEGYGIGVLDDRANEPAEIGPDAASCAFKAFGEGQFKGTTTESVTHGISCSPDGLRWNGGQTLTFPDPQVNRSCSTRNCELV